MTAPALKRMPEPESRRTHQPIRRRSRRVGSERGSIWIPVTLNKGDVLQLAEIYDRVHRKRGRRNGPLGHVGLEVLRYLWRTVDFKTGRLDPAIAQGIMRGVKRSKDAIVRALAALRDHGFLTWIRRYVEADGEGVRGPQVKQASNAYRLLLPAAARRLLRGRAAAAVDKARAAPPDDHQAGVAARSAELRRMAEQELDALPGVAKALAKSLWGVGPGAEAPPTKERESAGQDESGPSKIK